MYYTEEEAKKKWCPSHSASTITHGSSIRCIASDCMMWKRQIDIIDIEGGLSTKKISLTDKGYCGRFYEGKTTIWG